LTVLAIDLGGSHAACAVVAQGRVLAGSSMGLAGPGLAQLLPALADRLREHCRAAGVLPSACDGLGIGFPAIVDAERGEIISTLPGKLDDLSGVEILQCLRNELRLPVKLENDAKLALLGERSSGAARGLRDVVLVTLGTGIGSAVMLDGRLLRSRLGQAGNLGGHLSVDLPGPPCACGNLGCAEALASTSTLRRVCRGWNNFETSGLSAEATLDFAALFRWADVGDVVAKQVLSHCIRVWSVLAVSLVNAYGPELVLFGGGVMRRADAILPHVRAYVAAHAWKTTRGEVRVEQAALGDDAGLIGAQALFEQESA
jgi:glucokinase